MNGANYAHVIFVQIVQNVQPLRSVQSPTSFLPRVAGEDEGGGLIDLNASNVLNDLNLPP